MSRLTRRKDLEYKWISKGAFFVQAYTAKLKNGKTFVVYAHDFNDMEFFLQYQPISWMHFKGGIECPKTEKEGADG